jgi:hypothetical protein
MVAIYSSVYDASRYDGIDYAGDHSKYFSEWRTAATKVYPSIFKVREDHRYVEPTGWSGGMREPIIEVPLGKVGVALSRAASVRHHVDYFLNSHEVDDWGIYPALQRFLAGCGYDKPWEISGTGNIADKNVMAMVQMREGKAKFYHNRDFAEMQAKSAGKYKVSIEAARLYTMLHEIIHLYKDMGSHRDNREIEIETEALIWGFTEKMVKDLKESQHFSEAQRIRLMKLLMEVQKKADRRLEDYGVYEPDLDEPFKNTDRSALEKILEELEGETEGMSPEEARQYIDDKLAERNYGKVPRESRNYEKQYQEKDADENNEENAGGEGLEERVDEDSEPNESTESEASDSESASEGGEN